MRREGYQQAVELLHRCATPDGFLATTTELDNYRRVWGRDSSIMGVAALLTDQPELVAACRSSLLTLVAHQGPQGEIPSNVDARTERVSYGGTAGRVDADLWFVICSGIYWRTTRDESFLQRMLEPLERVQRLLRAWEFNTRGLLYIPPTGDWADEYLHNGYVLYDQLLYLQAQRELAAMHEDLHGSPDDSLIERVDRLQRLIRANYWFGHDKEVRDELTDEVPEDIYHEVLYRKGHKAARHAAGKYWMPFFSPLGYGFRFDTMANVLVSLFGVADESQARAVDEYIDQEIVPSRAWLLPAFHPVITPRDEEWSDLQMTFSYTFKNQPYEYHNGGLWPLVTGFYVASLARRGHTERAEQYCEGIHRANCSDADNRGAWQFPEFLNGQTFVPGGTSPLGWSAAAAVLAEQHLAGQRPFDISSHSDPASGRATPGTGG